MFSPISKVLNIKQGDFIRLKSPFRPNPYELKEYKIGVVVSLIYGESRPNAKVAVITGILLYLVDSESLKPYIDTQGVKALFYFQSNEIEPYQ